MDSTPTDNIFLVIEVDRGESGLALSAPRLTHGEIIAGRNIVAVIDGSLCGCRWCEDLKKRCKSRRRA